MKIRWTDELPEWVNLTIVSLLWGFILYFTGYAIFEHLRNPENKFWTTMLIAIFGCLFPWQVFERVFKNWWFEIKWFFTHLHWIKWRWDCFRHGHQWADNEEDVPKHLHCRHCFRVSTPKQRAAYIRSVHCSFCGSLSQGVAHKQECPFYEKPS